MRREVTVYGSCIMGSLTWVQLIRSLVFASSTSRHSLVRNAGTLDAPSMACMFTLSQWVASTCSKNCRHRSLFTHSACDREWLTKWSRAGALAPLPHTLWPLTPVPSHLSRILTTFYYYKLVHKNWWFSAGSKDSKDIYLVLKVWQHQKAGTE